MKLKRIAAIALAAVMTLSVCSCGKETQTDSSKEDTSSLAEVKIDKGKMHGYTAKELVGKMKTGWNLGNSLDATGGDKTAWGNPVTTKEMIDTVKEGGFDVLRVPVTWFEHLGAAPDYKVEEDYMKRVTEVVNYGIANDMYVILEIHHEPDNWLTPDPAHIDDVLVEFKALWKQIAESFADYGDKLVFEGMNEVRIKGSPGEWTSGTPEERECVNQLNTAFVDTVRATGGNNEQRLLLITTHGHQVTNSGLSDLTLPDDKYVGVALHAYTPYSFTYHSGESYEKFTWDGSENNSIDQMFNLINSYILYHDYPVIITECGAVVKTMEDGSENSGEVCKWVDYYYGEAKMLGIVCVWWDNGFFLSGNELFGIFDRKNCTWYSDDIRAAIVKVFE